MLQLNIVLYKLPQLTSPILDEVTKAITQDYFIPVLVSRLRDLSIDICAHILYFDPTHLLNARRSMDNKTFNSVLELCMSQAFGTPSILSLRLSNHSEPLPPNQLIMFSNLPLTQLTMELNWDYNFPPALSLNFHTFSRLTLSVQQMEHFSEFIESIHPFIHLKNIHLINWSHYPSEDDMIEIFTALTTCISPTSLTGLNFETDQLDPISVLRSG
jgi:hypothetical protein